MPGITTPREEKLTIKGAAVVIAFALACVAVVFLPFVAAAFLFRSLSPPWSVIAYVAPIMLLVVVGRMARRLLTP